MAIDEWQNRNMYPYISTVTDTKRLEDAKSSLLSAQSNITTALNSAEERLKWLNETLAQAQFEVTASKNRHAKLNALTESLCDRCWELFPALEESKFQRDTANACVNCGLPISIPSVHGFLGFPPSPDYLNQAESACNAAEAALKGEPQSPYGYGYGGIYGCNDAVTPSWRQSGHNHHFHNRLPEHDHSAFGKSKWDMLRIADEQVSKAQRKVNNANECIENWTKYYNQHKEQLEKVNKTLVDVEEQERKILESKLSKLSGGKRGGIVGVNSFSECAICMEREKDTVFQCGHQTCSECAWKIANCHTCRAYIIQRIRLHG